MNLAARLKEAARISDIMGQLCRCWPGISGSEPDRRRVPMGTACCMCCWGPLPGNYIIHIKYLWKTVYLLAAAFKAKVGKLQLSCHNKFESTTIACLDGFLFMHVFVNKNMVVNLWIQSLCTPEPEIRVHAKCFSSPSRVTECVQQPWNEN